MIETSIDPRTAEAFENAHAARSAAFTGFFKSLLRLPKIQFPLNQSVLTG